MVPANLLVQLALIFAVVVVTRGDTDEDKLLELRQKLVRDKSANYMKSVDPGRMTLHLGISLLCADYNPRTNVLTSRVFERYMWVDKRTGWKESDYGNLHLSRAPASRLWTPDVHVFNLHDEENTRQDVNAIVFSNGTIIWIPPSTYKTRCTHSPPERGQKEGKVSCQLHLGSWTYPGDYMHLEMFMNGIDINHYLSTCPYVVTNPTAVLTDRFYPCCPEAYPTLDINFEVHQRPEEDFTEEAIARKPGWLDVTASSPKRKHHGDKPHGPWQERTRKPRCFWPDCP